MTEPVKIFVHTWYRIDFRYRHSVQRMIIDRETEVPVLIFGENDLLHPLGL